MASTQQTTRATDLTRCPCPNLVVQVRCVEYRYVIHFQSSAAWSRRITDESQNIRLVKCWEGCRWYKAPTRLHIPMGDFVRVITTLGQRASRPRNNCHQLQSRSDKVVVLLLSTCHAALGASAVQISTRCTGKGRHNELDRRDYRLLTRERQARSRKC